MLYSYDDAGQLVGARSASHVWEWEYTAGVMMRERVFALDSSNGSERSAAGSRVLEGERIFTHNEANQLLSRITPTTWQANVVVKSRPISSPVPHTLANIAGVPTAA